MVNLVLHSYLAKFPYSLRVQPSRVAADCLVKIYDWDTVGSPDKLGQCKLDLAALEPYEASTVTLPLTKSDGTPEKGTLTVTMVFRPAFLDRTRASTTTFSAMPGRALTGVGGVGKAGVKGVAGVGKFAGKVCPHVISRSD